ncbi:MAG TPA: IS110 family transposase [Firmicutes bacterium]|nr:IS110 family transposase [Bacillota bacterium]
MYKKSINVAIEGTDVNWKPVYNILESTCHMVLANLRNVRNVPDRKADVCDAEWLAALLRYGLIRGLYPAQTHPGPSRRCALPQNPGQGKELRSKPVARKTLR